MFKMGCSMARKILGPGSAASSNEQMAAGAKGDAGAAAAAAVGAEKNGKQANKSADELGDFSKLEDDPRLPLNVRQIFKITKSWKAIARTMSKTGTAMFLNLFEQNQDLFYLFDRFQHLKGKELHESMELREHAATVMATLDQSINSLSDYDNFVSYLHSIGELHRKVPGFKREYFWRIEQPFMKAVKQTLDERCNETIEQIYVIAIKLIIETIAEGYGQDADSAATGRESGPGEAGGGGGGGGGGGRAAGNEARDRGVKEEQVGGRDVGGQKSGAGQRVGAQQQRTNCNENNRARQHAANWRANQVSASGCPVSRKAPSEQKQMNERKKSICEKGAQSKVAAGLAECEASLLEATCELMTSTGNWLHRSGSAHEASRVQWERLMNDLSANGGSLEANKGAAKCEVRDESHLAPLFTSSSETDSLKPDSHKWAAEKTARPAAAEQTQETRGCPRTPANTQHKSTPAKPEKRQIIISSCPARCEPPNELKLDLAQRGACEVQGPNSAVGAEHDGASAGRSSVALAGFRSQWARNIGQEERKQHLAMMGNSNDSTELVRSQVTGAPDSARVTLQPVGPRGLPESVELIKSARRRLGRLARWRPQLNHVPKLAKLPAGWPKSARSPKPTSDRNESATEGGLHCARQSRNNNKLQIRPHKSKAPSAGKITFKALSRGNKCKQGERPEARPIVDDRPPSNEELRAGSTGAKVGAMLHKSESAASKLLANARHDSQLAELIKVLLLINRLLLTLASRRQGQPQANSAAEATAQCPLFVAS